MSIGIIERAPSFQRGPTAGKERISATIANSRGPESLAASSGAWPFDQGSGASSDMLKARKAAVTNRCRIVVWYMASPLCVFGGRSVHNSPSAYRSLSSPDSDRDQDRVSRRLREA